MAQLFAPIHLVPSDPPFEDADEPDHFGGRHHAAGDELPYKVELWDRDKKHVEIVLAVSVNPTIGYAAFYAATREFVDRYVTLRHKKSVVTSWNPPAH
jgi:hypothetical protein